MSQDQVEVKLFEEKENTQLFSQLLEKIINTPRENRGPAAQAIMSSFQVYYQMIGGAAATAQKTTR
ncbi:hypothetical protein [Rhizobium leguminosarum]|uniref:hypothetical protein n=1 Tax=Rhizobium leguminosarum TaxID=384 RepID=UPI001F250A8C|nr:hypothetical protein [Rhizobium leguminosarum]UIJ81834.1 hypothetical protein LZK78_11390 [Rhizobium leguminosarum]